MRNTSLFFIFCIGLIVPYSVQGQCTDSWPSGNPSLQSLTTLTGWGCNSGGTLPFSGGTGTVANPYTYGSAITIGTMGNGDVITIDKSFTLTGNFTINSNAQVTITIPVGVTLKVIGNFTDANNNVTFNVQGSLIVTGSLVSNNNTVFSDGSSGGQTGTISVGTLDLGNNAKCDATNGCPKISATTCLPAGSNFCTNSVPIKLSSFTGKQEGESVQLQWSTSSELNFNYFSLQKSSDGKSFNELAQVSGNGTTNETHKYSYEDMDPIIGRSYYRLTSNDFDGYKETFQVISVDYHGGKKFHIYSNPSDGASINLHFNFETDADAMVTIYDNLGFVVGSFPARTETIVFANALKSGVYLAKYSSSSFTKTERFFVK